LLRQLLSFITADATLNTAPGEEKFLHPPEKTDQLSQNSIAINNTQQCDENRHRSVIRKTLIYVVAEHVYVTAS
jgi:hypothetical protein